MTTKDDYTAEEWTKIFAAPMVAGSYISMIDPGITSVVGESKGMLDAMMKGAVPEDAKDLIGGIVAGLQEMAQTRQRPAGLDLPDEVKKDPAAALSYMIGQITAAADAVAAKGSAEEATAYKQWIMMVANATAEAGKEGGFLGIGSVRVSEKEKEGLAKLSAALGL